VYNGHTDNELVIDTRFLSRLAKALAAPPDGGPLRLALRISRPRCFIERLVEALAAARDVRAINGGQPSGELACADRLATATRSESQE